MSHEVLLQHNKHGKMGMSGRIERDV